MKFDHLMFCNCGQAQYFSSEKQKLLTLALILVLFFAAIEWFMGFWSHSVTLQADAGHILADAIALSLALITMIISRHSKWVKFPLDGISAFINSISLLVMSVMILWEAVEHLQHPPTEILSLPMLITAIIGLFVNGINICLLHDHSKQDLNLRGAFLHIIADTLSSLAVIIAALILWYWHWILIDTILAFIVAILILGSGFILLWQSYQQLFIIPQKTVKLVTNNPLSGWDLSSFSDNITQIPHLELKFKETNSETLLK